MKLLATIATMLILTGCSTIDMKAYIDNEPRLDLFNYFTGETKGWGIVQDRKGTLLRQFVVDINGEVNDGGQLVLYEDFDWNDGEQSSRTWILDRQSEHLFTGTAEDVVGTAEGALYGNVLNWMYQLDVEVGDNTWRLTFDDWMFKVSEEMVINKAVMSKFGYRVGEVTIVFKK